MHIIKEYRNIIRYKLLDSNLYLLNSDRIHSSINCVSNNLDQFVWKHRFQKYIYYFEILDDKIYLTTGNDEQKTYVVDRISGKILDDDFKAVLHLPLFDAGNKRYICYATYNNKNIDLIFTKYLTNFEIIDFEDIDISKRLDDKYFLNIQKNIIKLYNYENLNKVFEINISQILKGIYLPPFEIKPRVSLTRLHSGLIIMNLIDLKNYEGYLLGIDIKTGFLKWHHQGYSNFELHNSKIYNIEFYGQYRVLNPETGEIEQEEDLRDEFERVEINCEHRFNVTDTHIYFKHAIKGKFGILNKKTLKIEEVQQLPEGNTMSTEEYPIPFDNRLYVRSAPQNNLFVYE